MLIALQAEDPTHQMWSFFDLIHQDPPGAKQ